MKTSAQQSEQQFNAEELLCRQVKTLALMGVDEQTIKNRVDDSLHELSAQMRGPNHYMLLPNGHYLVISYGENELSIGSSFNGSEVAAWICLICSSGTLVMPNSSDAADAFTGLKLNGEEPPRFTHSDAY